MAFDFSKLSGTKKTQIVILGEQEVTVTEIPFILLLRVKKIKKVLSSCISKFSQRVPLANESLVTEKVPMMAGDVPNKIPQEMVTETMNRGLANLKIINKSVELKEQAISDLVDTLLDDDLLFDVLRTTVLEFKDFEKETLLGEDGLTVPMMFKLFTALIELNSKDLEFLGNFFSLLKQKG